MANSCPKCNHKIDTNENYDCPNCGEKFWQLKDKFNENKNKMKSEEETITSKSDLQAYCSNCDKDVGANDKFCAGCGELLEDEPDNKRGATMLTDERKKEIEEEEELRRHSRAKIQGQNLNKNCTGCTVFIVVIIIILWALISTNSKSSNSVPTTLSATVASSIDGIKITNNDTDQWDNCTFKLNNDYSDQPNGYLSSNGSVTVPYVSFTKSDGTRFNVFNTKPQSVLVDCQVKGGHRVNIYNF
jgi:uncharacterized membrane protein YvbJ